MSRGGSPAFEDRTADWLDFPEAVQRILAAASPLPTELLPLSDAVGRALAEPVSARAALPPWDNAGMDGYAVRGSDIAGASPGTPVMLRMVGVARAGSPPAPTLKKGEAVRIMTGAPVPPGADSVVRVEDTDGERSSGQVRVVGDRDVGRNVRPGGQDMRPGDRVLDAGTTLSPGAVGVAAALGLANVSVHRRPDVAILATGDELLPADRYDEVERGAGVPESNGPMVAAAVREAGGRPHLLPTAPDDPDLLAERLEEGRAADVLVTIGGASMGEADLVKRVLDAVGYQQSFWRVRIRPGSPFSFGFLPPVSATPASREGTWVFGLPGNPASAFVTFEVFVRPFLRRLAGHTQTGRRRIRCVAGERLPGPAELTYFLRVRVKNGDAGPTVFLTGPQNSGLVRGLATADGLAVVPAARPAIEEGEEVEVFLLNTDAAHA